MARYRTYYRTEDEPREYATTFLWLGGGEWECTHSAWSGFVIEGDELTLWIKPCGEERSLKYARYEEWEESDED